MILNNIGYSYQDLTIVPAQISDISSRSECNPFDDNGMLPIFTAPMSTITNTNNVDIWKQNKITPIIPRNINIETRILRMIQHDDWVALSLNEFNQYFVERTGEEFPKHGNTYKVCVDLANGHMKKLYSTINKAKKLSREFDYNLIIMTGNIANPDTYEWICRHADVDYIRVSIGNGANCITSTQTSIHYPIATLINECSNIKSKIKKTSLWEAEHHNISTPYYGDMEYHNDGGWAATQYISRPMIVADGGIRGYADVIKALGLGADYVMIGSLFTGLLESAAPLIIECYNSHYQYTFDPTKGYTHDGISWSGWSIWSNDNEDLKRNFIHDMKCITKESYGMSTKKAQMLINPNARLKTSEGCTKYIKVKETVKQWTDNMIDYLKSSMSYTSKRVLSNFIGRVNFIVNSNCAILAVNK